MSENEIRTYAALMAELGLTGVEVTEGQRTVRLERAVGGGTLPQPVHSPAVQPAPSPQEGAVISSPLVGVFYTAPAEDAEPFVKPGDRVTKGQTLCIIEAMKLMNEITAEADGEILEVLAENGQIVDFGKPLFRWRT